MAIDIKKIKEVGEKNANLVSMFKTYLESDKGQKDIEDALIETAEQGKTTARVFIGLPEYKMEQSRGKYVILKFQISGKVLHTIVADMESARHSCRNNFVTSMGATFTNMLDDQKITYRELESRNATMTDWDKNDNCPLLTYIISLIKEE